MGIDTHSDAFTVHGPTHNLPYEPDKFSVKPILMVPFAVIATGIAAFIITTLIFDNIFDPQDPEKREASKFPIAAERGKAPLNERMARMSSTDPKADVNAPRLEGMKLTEVLADKDGKPGVTSEWTTTLPLKQGNSPAYHPEDLRADRQAGLTGYAKTKHGQTVIPVGKAMDLIAAGLVESAGDPLPLHADWDRPKESNGGRRNVEPEPKKPAAKKADEPKKDEKK